MDEFHHTGIAVSQVFGGAQVFLVTKDGHKLNQIDADSYKNEELEELDIEETLCQGFIGAYHSNVAEGRQNERHAR